MRLGGSVRMVVCSGVVCVVTLALAGAVGAAPASAPAGQVAAKKPKPPAAKPLTRAQVIALIKLFVGQGPAGPTGPAGAQGATGTPGPGGVPGGQGPPGLSTGAAGGDLTGFYPNPSIASGAVTDAKVAAANKDGTAGTPSLRTLGTSAAQAMPGNATPGGPPTGAAGSALAGTYPNPTLNVSGGPCPNGRALSNVSALAALTCAPGVFSDGSFNVAAGPSPFGALTTGNSNVAVGPSMLTNNTTGVANSAVGVNALLNNTVGDSNSALGKSALATNTSGGYNSAVGQSALQNNTTGIQNSAFGQSALGANTASNNSAFGQAALSANTSGTQNSAVGQNALVSVTAGSFNSAVGQSAGFNLTTGNSNILLGASAGSNYTGAESNNIDIGTNGTTGESNVTRIRNISGATSTSGIAVLVNPGGQLGTTTSSRRYKTDIHPLASVADGLMALRPVSFHYKPQYIHGQPDLLQYGLIAEDVATVYPALVANGPDNKPHTVRYQELPVLLLAKVQRQQRQIQREHQQIAALRARNRHQQAQIDWLMHHARLR